MVYDLWGESPLDENEDLKVGSIPTVTPIEKVLETRNCVRATERGEEATSQSCEATDRNLRPTLRVGARAGADRRVSQASRSRFRSSALVNRELVQRKPYALSWEIRRTYLHVRLA